MPVLGSISVKNRLVIERVVSELYEPVYRFALSLTHSEDDAADLTQEAFLNLCQRNEQVREPDKIKSWLFTTLRRAVFQTVRRRRSHREVELNANDQPQSRDDPTGTLPVDSRVILCALSELGEDYRTVLELFYVADLSYREISTTLQIPIGTVMFRLSRAKEQLRGVLTSVEARRQIS